MAYLSFAPLLLALYLTGPVAAEVPTLDASALAQNASFVNRTNLNDAIIPPGGCLTFSITAAGAEGQCIMASTADFLEQGPTSQADYTRHNITTSPWYNATEQNILSGNCTGPEVTEVYEEGTHCAIAAAATNTVGLGNTNIQQSFVCTNQGTDTTAYTHLWGFNQEEQDLCAAVKQLAQSSAESVTLESSKACSVRLTYVVSNPCETNLTVVLQNHYSIGFASDVPAVAPAPVEAPSMLPASAPSTTGLSPAIAPAMAPGPGSAPVPAPMVAAAPAPAAGNTSTAAGTGTTAGKKNMAGTAAGVSFVVLATAAALVLV